MAKQEDFFKNVISHAKEYGYIFASSEIYDGLSAVYDYGQNGAELKKNIKDYWWKSMVQLHQNIVGLDAAILMHPTTWKASGHVDAFNDPLIDNKDSKKRYRADVLVEDYAEKINQKAQKEIAKAKKRFGDKFNEEEFVTTNPRVLRYKKEEKEILERLAKSLTDENLADVKALIEELGIACPESGSKNWTDVKQFNLMFGTKLGASADSATDLYLRPETAQGIFVNFSNVQKTGRMKIPFGIAQIGKAFRNEITTGNFIFRTREFEMMEIEYFVKPEDSEKYYKEWIDGSMEFILSLNINKSNLRIREHSKEDLSHYSKGTSDIEYKFPWGWAELQGIANRGSFDLDAHSKSASKNFTIFEESTKSRYTPHVIEPSIGVDRLLLITLLDAYNEEKLESKEEKRTVLKLSPKISPIKIAILPLSKDPQLSELSKKIQKDLINKGNLGKIEYDETQSNGKRYRRQDEIGTPYCVTIDFETIKDNSVTIRHRDSMDQERININDLSQKLTSEIYN